MDGSPNEIKRHLQSSSLQFSFSNLRVVDNGSNTHMPHDARAPNTLTRIMYCAYDTPFDNTLWGTNFPGDMMHVSAMDKNVHNSSELQAIQVPSVVKSLNK